MDNEYQEFTAKTLDDAILEAAAKLGVKTTNLTYEIVSRGTSGFLGIGAKPFVIKAKGKTSIDEEIDQILMGDDQNKESKYEKKYKNKDNEIKSSRPAELENAEKEEILKVNSYDDLSEKTFSDEKFSEKKEKSVEPIDPDVVEDGKEYLKKILTAMEINVEVTADIENTNVLSIDVEGPDVGFIIGKRGQTLDSLQYLVSLYVNKKSENYVRVKLDTENYRERRKETLETLAKNISFKVKRTRRPFKLEPMNPYERRIIHSTLQNDHYVTTKSEGEEPYRRVVIYPKRRNGYGYQGNHARYENNNQNKTEENSENQ